jgi:hypothetical protein
MFSCALQLSMSLQSKLFFNVAVSASVLGLAGLNCTSCSHPRPGKVPIHVSLGGSYVDSQYVSLKVNGIHTYEKIWKQRHHQTTQCWMPDKQVTIYSRMGSHDTIFTLYPNHSPVYVSIIYSRFHHRFMVQRHDSSSYWRFGAGSNDMVEYDVNGNVVAD